MALIKLPYLLKIIESDNLIYWKVSDGAGIIDSYQATKGNADESINQLQECLDNLEGYYDVILSVRNGMETGGKGGDLKSAAAIRKFRIKCSGGNESAAVTGIQNQNSGADKYLQEIKNLYQQNSELQKQLIEAANEKRFADLEKKFSDLKAEYESEDEEDQQDQSGIEGIERILNHPLVAKLSGSFLASAQDDKIRKLAGHEQEAIETQTTSFTPEYITDQKKKCSQAAGRLLRVDAEAGNALLLLADLAESKPSVYAMAKEQIKNFL